MNFGIDGKRALVMAAGGGLGGAIARGLAAEGVSVIAADVAAGSAQATADSIRGSGGVAEAMEWDLADLAATPGNVAAARQIFGDVDILVNMSGGPPPSPAAGIDPAQWSEYFQSMVLGVIHLTDALLPAMRAAGWGRIITSTSSGVVAPIPNLGLSNSLRMSLVGWSKTLAGEVGREGITSNIVVPGRIATQRITQLDAARAEREGSTVQEVAGASTSAIPLGRYGRPAEYAAAVTFLASDAASYITGSVVRVDGGLISAV